MQRLRDDNVQLHTQLQSMEKRYSDMCQVANNLKGEVNSLTKTNTKFVAQLEGLEQQKNDLENVCKMTEKINESLELQVGRLSSEVEQLSERNHILGDRLVEFRDSIRLFGENVEEIEEKLFKTVKEYKEENRVQHGNNIMHIFISCDTDRDGRLNAMEFALFRDYIDKVYGQTVEFSGHNMSIRDILDLDIKPRFSSN